MQSHSVRIQSWILIKTLFISLGILTVLFFLAQNYAYAHESEVPQVTTTAETVVVNTTGDDTVTIIPDAYEYTASTGNNMSILVRRSIMLYDQGNDTVELTQAQIIFIETNIVQQMGPRLLNINDSFEVSRNLIEKYTAQTPEISKSTLAAWDNYAKTANFDLTEIVPTNVPLNDDGTLDTEYTPPPPPTDAPATADTSDSTPVYWWIIGLGAIVLLTALMTPSRREK